LRSRLAALRRATPAQPGARLRGAVGRLRAVRYLRAAAARWRWRGLQGSSVLDVARFFVQEVRSSKLNVRSAAVTYNFLMAIPPTLLFIFSLVPYLPLSGVQATLVDAVYLVVPDRDVATSINGVLIDFLNTEQGGVLSFGILLTLFFSSNGMMGLMRSFDRALPAYKPRTGLAKRWMAIKLTLLLILVVILMLAGLAIQSAALNDLLMRHFGGAVAVRIVSSLLITGLLFCAVSAVYTYAPSLSQRFPFVSAGSVIATLLSVAATGAFFFIADRFIQYNKVYGSIGTLIAFMVWTYINTLIILLGFELNVSILLARVARASKTVGGVHPPSY